MRLISLDHLTVFELTPPELVRTAALAGFKHVGMRLHPAAPAEQQHPMTGNSPMLRETLALLQDTGVSVFDFGVLRLKDNTRVADFEPVLEAAAMLRAGHAVVNGDEPDPQRLAELFARLCELGQGYGLTLNLEPTPWTGVQNLAQATRVVQAAAQANGRVMIDTLHLDRAGGSAADIAAVPVSLIAYAQLCDGIGPRPKDFETMIFQARNERAFPGEGSLDLAGMLRALPPDTPLSLEAPTRHAAAGMTALDRAKRGRAALDALLASLGSGGLKPAGG
jgi:sugar phosphate isomerase/epimerase